MLVAIAAVLAWLDRDDLAGLLRALRQAPAGVGIALLVHVPQIALTAFAWQVLMRGPERPGAWLMLRLRWLREAANALLPAGGLIGQTLAARLLIRRGVPADIAASTATVDLTIEAATQVLFTLTGLALLLRARGGAGLGTVGLGTVGLGSVGFGTVLGLGLAASGLAVGALVTVQRRLPLDWLRRRLPRRWAAGVLDRVESVQRDVRRLHRAPSRLLLATLLHSAAWSLGALEVAGVLRLLGIHLDLAHGLVIESIAQALRSAGFAVPGAMGIQEGAIVGACALVGVPPAPALVLALVRRAREMLVGVTGLASYRGTTPRGMAGG